MLHPRGAYYFYVLSISGGLFYLVGLTLGVYAGDTLLHYVQVPEESLHRDWTGNIKDTVY